LYTVFSQCTDRKGKSLGWRVCLALIFLAPFLLSFRFYFFFLLFFVDFMRRKWRRFVVARHSTQKQPEKNTRLVAQWTAKMLHVAGGFAAPFAPRLTPGWPLFFGAAAIHKRGRLILVPRGLIFPRFLAFGPQRRLNLSLSLSFSCDFFCFWALALALRLGKWPAALRLNFKL